MARVLHLFVDTNLFIQCKALEELVWDGWADFDEIELIVSRPVQAEIDAQKNKGNDRLGKRARRASGIFREVISSSDRRKIISATRPVVTLLLRQDLKPSPELTEQLSYDSRDDQLVGIAHAFAKSHAGEEIRVLTHDTGLMCSADMVGLAFCPIPDAWLLEPEPSESERRLAALQNELSQLAKNEPSFQIEFADHTGQKLNRLELELSNYCQLTDLEISELLDRVRKRSPEAVTFDNPTATETVNSILGAYQTSSAVSQEKIRDYQRDYLKWQDECEAFFRSYHQKLNRPKVLHFKFLISNVGFRPGDDALITLEAKGKFLIGLPKELAVNKLPSPPAPPRRLDLGSLLAEASRSMGVGRNFPSPIPPTFNRPRDPNAFYYVDRPVTAVAKFSLECKQWRHGLEAEAFGAAISLPSSGEQIEGVLVCEVRAANLRHTATLTVPVRLRMVDGDTFEDAARLVGRPD